MAGKLNDPRQLERRMRELGLSTENVEGVQEVVIRTAQHDRVFHSPEVTILTVKGVRTYQIVGTPETRPRSPGAPAPAGAPAAAPGSPVGPPEEDIQLVIEQASVSREQAIEALFVSGGQPAEAILSLLSRRGPG